MSFQPVILIPWTRIGLALLGFLMVASTTARLYVHRYPPEAKLAEAGTAADALVDLGDSILLPGADALPRSVQLRACSAPASVNIVEAHPHASDPSLVGAPRPSDRVAYVYHGWHLEGRFATTGLNVIYFVRRAQARLAMRDSDFPDNMALKIIVPENCSASPEDVMTVLRQQVRSKL